jgi:hypothetical protein
MEAKPLNFALPNDVSCVVCDLYIKETFLPNNLDLTKSYLRHLYKKKSL